MLYELRILSGLNMGAAFPLTKKKHVISNDINADIFIRIEDDTKVSFALDKQNEGWMLDDSVSGKKELILTNKVFKIQNGHYVVRLTTDDWDDKLPLSSKPVVSFKSGKSIFIIFNVVLFSSFLIFTTQDGKHYDAEKQKAGEVNSVESFLSAEEAGAWLRKTLRDYELHQHIKLVESSGGFILEGELLFEQTKRKNKAIKLYQDKFQKKIYDNTNLREVSTTPFDIKQVVSSNPAHVVTINDDYIFVGDELNGWRLKTVNKINAEFEKIN